eukprot:m.246589 g.246589  ORF g.246589 m.246589 type:complete len:160 (-) comp33848_c4_seq1:191-670(-)
MFGPVIMIGIRVLVVLAAIPLHTAALGNCSFPLDLRGFECFGLQLAESATSEAECATACCASESCTTWQFCGDFTTYCGAEHGGCYIGQWSHCLRSEHCDGLDCWDGGCRGEKCPKLPPPPPPTPPSLVTTPARLLISTHRYRCCQWTTVETTTLTTTT